MLEKIKLALRYRTNVFDSEIQTYINACLNDLSLAGVKTTFTSSESMNVIDDGEGNVTITGVNASGDSNLTITDDNLNETITSACISYCKWQLNFQDKGETWEKIYKNQKTAIVLDSRFR